MIVPLTGGEPVVRRAEREISILLARQQITITHAHDGGFAAFMRGVRDGVTVEWDISAVPADGGLPARAAIVSPNHADEHSEAVNQPSRLRCSLPDLRVEDRRLHGPHPLDLALHDRDSEIDTWLTLDGAVEATLAGTRRPSAQAP